jgi:hypothetical protein
MYTAMILLFGMFIGFRVCMFFQERPPAKCGHGIPLVMSCWYCARIHTIPTNEDDEKLIDDLLKRTFESQKFTTDPVKPKETIAFTVNQAGAMSTCLGHKWRGYVNWSGCNGRICTVCGYYEID